MAPLGSPGRKLLPHPGLLLRFLLRSALRVRRWLLGRTADAVPRGRDRDRETRGGSGARFGAGTVQQRMLDCWMLSKNAGFLELFLMIEKGLLWASEP